MAVPLTDEEVGLVYAEAIRERLGESPPAAEVRVSSSTRDADTWLNGICAAMLWLALLNYQGPETASSANIAFAAIVLTVLTILGAFGGPVIGLFSLADRASASFDWVTARHPSTPPVRVTPEMLDVVVDHIARRPLGVSAELVERISLAREEVQRSTGLLPKLIQDLRAEEQDEDESVALLVRSKREAAERVLATLQQQDAALARQAEEAKEAVEPVRRIVEKFDRIQRLNLSLATIREAHGLVESTEEAILDHRQQLEMLRASSLKAIARLREIEGMLDARTAAQHELQTAIDAPA
jgi:hypothetical protein